MDHLPNISPAAALIGDPARALMLGALIGDKALPAGELAYAAGITAQTASSHLAKMLDGGLLRVECEGRHRYYRLAGPHVAQVLELLGSIRPSAPARRKALSPLAKELRFARCCYDHLAGQLGVAVAQALEREHHLVRAGDKRFRLTETGAAWFRSVGVDAASLRATRRGLARQCLDWTEREHHLAGPLGVALLRALCEAGWLRRAPDSRAVTVTPKGRVELRRRLEIDVAALSCEAVEPSSPRPRSPAGAVAIVPSAA